MATKNTPAAPFNLEEMTSKDLRQMRADLDKRLQSLEESDLRNGLDQIKTIATESQITVEQIVAFLQPKGRKAGRPRGTTNGVKTEREPGTMTAPKYRHPENPELTWTGRGRKPTWFKDYEGDTESLLISPVGGTQVEPGINTRVGETPLLPSQSAPVPVSTQDDLQPGQARTVDTGEVVSIDDPYEPEAA